LLAWTILGTEDAMETTIQLPAEKTNNNEALYVASTILRDAHAIIQGVHVLVAVLLRYVEIGTAITNTLMNIGTPVLSE
jgi:hypothetical protein